MGFSFSSQVYLRAGQCVQKDTGREGFKGLTERHRVVTNRFGRAPAAGWDGVLVTSRVKTYNSRAGNKWMYPVPPVELS